VRSRTDSCSRDHRLRGRYSGENALHEELMTEERAWRSMRPNSRSMHMPLLHMTNRHILRTMPSTRPQCRTASRCTCGDPCYPLLSFAEEQALAKRCEKGDEEARARMIASNLRLVVAVGKRYVNRGLHFSDIIEEGNLDSCAPWRSSTIGMATSSAPTPRVDQTVNQRAIATRSAWSVFPCMSARS